MDFFLIIKHSLNIIINITNIMIIIFFFFIIYIYSKKKNNDREKKKEMSKNKKKSRNLKRKKERTLNWLNKNNINPFLGLNQELAAKKLDVSVSTLKRRFYSLNLGRWPLNTNRTILKRKMEIKNILNYKNINPKFIDLQTLQFLNECISKNM
jgi:hypothetical protein